MILLNRRQWPRPGSSRCLGRMNPSLVAIAFVFEDYDDNFVFPDGSKGCFIDANSWEPDLGNGWLFQVCLIITGHGLGVS